MKIRVGFEMAYQCPQLTPMILALRIHYSRASDLVLFGNWCSRVTAPQGRFMFASDAVVNDDGVPEVVAPWATQTPVAFLPESALAYLLRSRYCETRSRAAP